MYMNQSVEKSLVAGGSGKDGRLRWRKGGLPSGCCQLVRPAVNNGKGQSADVVTLLRRWAIVWLPLFFPMSFVALLTERAGLAAAFIWAVMLLVLWTSAAVYAVIVPNRGLHDRLAGTWVVRR